MEIVTRLYSVGDPACGRWQWEVSLEGYPYQVSDEKTGICNALEAMSNAADELHVALIAEMMQDDVLDLSTAPPMPRWLVSQTSEGVWSVFRAVRDGQAPVLDSQWYDRVKAMRRAQYLEASLNWDGGAAAMPGWDDWLLMHDDRTVEQRNIDSEGVPY